jgi:adenosylhomocysteine nucleosidase
MLGIVYATRREADPFLAQIDAECVASRPFLLFRGRAAGLRPLITVISGMGKVAAAMAAMHLVLDRRVSILFNAGLCGRLGTDAALAAGDLLRVTRAVEGDCDRFGRGEAPVDCDRRWFDGLKAARLVTCDKPVFDRAWRARLAQSGDLADMEGAAVARVARLYGIPCAMLKGISDGADESGRQELAANIDRVSARIAEVLVGEMAADKGS